MRWKKIFEKMSEIQVQFLKKVKKKGAFLPRLIGIK